MPVGQDQRIAWCTPQNGFHDRTGVLGPGQGDEAGKACGQVGPARHQQQHGEQDPYRSGSQTPRRANGNRYQQGQRHVGWHLVLDGLRGTVGERDEGVQQEAPHQQYRQSAILPQQQQRAETRRQEQRAVELKVQQGQKQSQPRREVLGGGEGEHVTAEALAQHVFQEPRKGDQVGRGLQRTGRRAQWQVDQHQQPRQGSHGRPPPATRRQSQARVHQQQVGQEGQTREDQREMVGEAEGECQGEEDEVPVAPCGRRAAVGDHRVQAQGGEEGHQWADAGLGGGRPEGGGGGERQRSDEPAPQRPGQAPPGAKQQRHGESSDDGRQQVDAPRRPGSERQACRQPAEHRVQGIAGRVSHPARRCDQLELTGVGREHVRQKGGGVEHEGGQEDGHRQQTVKERPPHAPVAFAGSWPSVRLGRAAVGPNYRPAIGHRSPPTPPRGRPR